MISNTLDHTSAFPVFSEEECGRISNTIFSLRTHWKERSIMSPFGPVVFWTLGEATYLDGDHAHKLAREESNRVLKNAFDPWYELLTHKLCTALGAEVRIELNYALPGFHIYLGNPSVPTGIRFGGSIHYDTPHLQSKFDFEYSKNLSFTVPLRIPKKGAGLNYWPHVPKDIGIKRWYDEMDPIAQEWLISNKKYRRYAIGELVLHDGLTLHQIANEVSTDESDYRITLQGHGVLRGYYWMLFF